MASRRLPLPGPSFLKEESIRIHAGRDDPGRAIRLGMAAPSATEDGWWLALLWAADDEGILDAREVAPRAGPPPGPPLLTIGPALTGALSGLVAQEGGRQALRLRLPPADDEARAWERPLLLQLAIKWEPLRAATMSANELGREALRAFGRALLAAGQAR
jgi:hypothetical protein